LTGEDGFESSQQRLALLTQRCQIPAQGRERLGPRIAAEAAGDFLLDLEPTQVTLGLVVVERDAQLVEEGEDLLLAQGRPFEEVARRRLGEASALARLLRHGRLRPSARRGISPMRGSSTFHWSSVRSVVAAYSLRMPFTTHL
jgi:hypothetical protein